LRHDRESQDRSQPASRRGSSWESGMRLTEEALSTSGRGRIMNPSLAEYHVPVNLDVPHIEILFMTFPMNTRRWVRAELVKSALRARGRDCQRGFSTRQGKRNSGPADHTRQASVICAAEVDVAIGNRAVHHRHVRHDGRSRGQGLPMDPKLLAEATSPHSPHRKLSDERRQMPTAAARRYVTAPPFNPTRLS